jgi:hypothetical protein
VSFQANLCLSAAADSIGKYLYLNSYPLLITFSQMTSLFTIMASLVGCLFFEYQLFLMVLIGLLNACTGQYGIVG